MVAQRSPRLDGITSVDVATVVERCERYFDELIGFRESRGARVDASEVARSRVRLARTLRASRSLGAVLSASASIVSEYKRHFRDDVETVPPIATTMILERLVRRHLRTHVHLEDPIEAMSDTDLRREYEVARRLALAEAHIFGPDDRRERARERLLAEELDARSARSFNWGRRGRRRSTESAELAQLCHDVEALVGHSRTAPIAAGLWSAVSRRQIDAVAVRKARSKASAQQRLAERTAKYRARAHIQN